MWRKIPDLKLLIGLTIIAAMIFAIACNSGDEPAASDAPQQSESPTETPTSQAASPSSGISTNALPRSSSTPALTTSAPTRVAAPLATSKRTDADAPSGHLIIAVQSVGTPNGLPRFCTAGCAEIIYLSGATDVLFNSKATPESTATFEPMLALDFSLDSSLEFGTFNLRKGVMFHDGWGEMTADDVAFSFNDANSVTNSDSIHGQARDFAPLIRSLEALDTYTVQLNFVNFDSRGILHRFSKFWQTAGIVSEKVFKETGVDGMQDIYVGVGPFVIDQWNRNDGIFMHANPDYYGTDLGLGPFVQNVTWIEVPSSPSRRAMLESGEVQIASVSHKDILELTDQGFKAQKKGLLNTIDSISFTGNYWEKFSPLSGAELQRDRNTSKPWVGDPFEGGGDFDNDTASMTTSRLVRNALAWAINRDELVQQLLSGVGSVNYQPYLSIRHPNHKAEWNWGTDIDKAKSMFAEAGYESGFEMELWVGTNDLESEIGGSVGAGWQEHLGVKGNLIRTSYSSYRPGLATRSTDIPFIGCGEETKSNFPYDWAHGFLMSSISAGEYGVGMEIPWASETYVEMLNEIDKDSREAFASAFYQNNADNALCVGIFERPIWPIFAPDTMVNGDWDMRPMADDTLSTINNIRSIKLK
jgi:ABC-type transport system substrate-binding protein